MDWKVKRFARLGAWTGCAVTTLNTELERGGREEMLFLTLYETNMRRAPAGILKMGLKLVKDVHAAKIHRAMVWKMKKEKIVSELQESSDCGAVGVVCREGVQSNARIVTFREQNKKIRICF